MAIHQIDDNSSNYDIYDESYLLVGLRDQNQSVSTESSFRTKNYNFAWSRPRHQRQSYHRESV